MKRRHFLKLAAVLPFIGPALAMAAQKKDELVVLAPYYPIYMTPDLSTLRGRLTVVIGPPKFGKTAYAKTLAASPGSNYYVLDDIERFRDPAADCAYLLSKGINVIAVVRENKDTLLMAGYGAGPETLRRMVDRTTSRLTHQADRVILITGFSLLVLPAAGEKKLTRPITPERNKVHLSWRIQTLIDRTNRPGQKWEWHTTVPFGFGMHA